ncbi:MAG: hypoxanthine-guanine phosphoribosyltransferase [Gammaproteobacteria bacterium]|nr:hypoxanthine-guanine phosphoribosyltransferase [Gammaproteobacteria bacterium]
MSLTREQITAVRESARCLHSRERVDEAIARLAQEVSASLAGQRPIVYCVLHGGATFFGRLLPLLDFPLETDYVHASRYRGGLRGGDLQWRARPTLDPRGRVALLVDDILDEGVTLAGIQDWLLEQGAASVYKTVLVKKEQTRGYATGAEFVGLSVPDEYVFGCGMDYRGWWRNLPEIYAARETSVGEEA